MCKAAEHAVYKHYRRQVGRFGPKVVIKQELSSSGQGVRVCEGLEALVAGAALEKWTGKCLRRDGVVTVEPWFDVRHFRNARIAIGCFVQVFK